MHDISTIHAQHEVYSSTTRERHKALLVLSLDFTLKNNITNKLLLVGCLPSYIPITIFLRKSISGGLSYQVVEV